MFGWQGEENEDYRQAMRDMHPDRSFPPPTGSGSVSGSVTNGKYGRNYTSMDGSTIASETIGSRRHSYHTANSRNQGINGDDTYTTRDETDGLSRYDQSVAGGGSTAGAGVFLHKLDPTYKNHMRRHQLKKQETIQAFLKIIYLIIAFSSVFGFFCIMISQKLVTYSNLGSVLGTTMEQKDTTFDINKDFSMDRITGITDLLTPVSPKDIGNTNSPQYRALKWIMNDDAMNLPTPSTTEEKARLIQRYILVVLYFATGGEQWKNQYSFLSEKHECLWNQPNDGFFNGVGGCSKANKEITLIALWENNLIGSIPTEIGLLTSLNALSLFDNELVGEVPSQLKTLTKLQSLYVHNNNLEGNLKSLCKLGIKDVRADCTNPQPKVECICCSVCCNREGECYNS